MIKDNKLHMQSFEKTNDNTEIAEEKYQLFNYLTNHKN